MSPVFRGSKGTGIPVTSRAGGFGEHHWSRRWMADLDERAGRSAVAAGRSAARAQWVLDVQVGWRKVRASVEGSQPEPFEVVFEFAELDADELRTVQETVRHIGLPNALAGTVPDELAAVLLPALTGAVRFGCTCPEQPGPCAHAVAVACVLVERLDHSPQDLFRLRGYPPRGGRRGLGSRSSAAVVAGEERALQTGSAARSDRHFGGTLVGEPSRSDSADLARFWDADPALPQAPRCSGRPADLLDGPTARALAAAISHGSTLGTLAVLADLEDLYSDLDSEAKP